MNYSTSNIGSDCKDNKLLQQTIFFAAIKLEVLGILQENDELELEVLGNPIHRDYNLFYGLWIIRNGQRLRKFYSFLKDLNLCNIEIDGKNTNLLNY